MPEAPNPFTMVDNNIANQTFARVRGNADVAESLRLDCETALTAILAEATTDNGSLAWDRVVSISGGVGEKIEKVVKMHSELTGANRALGELHNLPGAINRTLMAGHSNDAAFASGIIGASGAAMPTLSSAIFDKIGGFHNFRMEDTMATLPNGAAIIMNAPRAAVFQTSDGYPTEVTSQRVVPALRPPIDFIQQLGTPIPSTQNSYKYGRPTITAAGAAERAEGVKAAEADYSITNVTAEIRSIATYIPITDEQLADQQSAEAWINNTLIQEARIRLDTQMANGDNVAPNLQGVRNVAPDTNDITAPYAANKTTDPLLAIAQAIGKVRTAGKRAATGIGLNPTVWHENIAIAKDTNGQYLLGSPALSVQPILWGLPVSLVDELPADDTAGNEWGVVGDFLTSADLVMRQEADVMFGYIADDFAKVQKTARVTMRAAFAWYRPEAFSVIKRG